jgi:hypothetical protein
MFNRARLFSQRKPGPQGQFRVKTIVDLDIFESLCIQLCTEICNLWDPDSLLVLDQGFLKEEAS